MKVRKVAVLTGLLVGLVFSGWLCIGSLMEQSRLARQASHQQDIARALSEMALITDIIHALQKERGLTVGFAELRPSVFQNRIRGYRRDTDQAIAALGQEQSHPASDYLTHTQARLKPLANLRQSIERGDANRLTIFEGYSEIIRRLLLTSFNHIRVVFSDAPAQSNPYYWIYDALNLMYAREYAGQLRAMGSLKITQDLTLDARHSQRLHTLNANHHYYLDRITRLSNSPIAEAVRTERRHPDSQSLYQLTEQLLNHQLPAELTATDWWQRQTTYIDRLHRVQLMRETQLLQRAQSNTAQLQQQQRGQKQRVGLALAIGLALLFTLWRQLGHLPASSGQTRSVSLWQMALLMTSLLTIMLVEHYYSQAQLEQRLRSQAVDRLQASAIDTLTLLSEAWFTPLQETLQQWTRHPETSAISRQLLAARHQQEAVDYRQAQQWLLPIARPLMALSDVKGVILLSPQLEVLGSSEHNAIAQLDAIRRQTPEVLEHILNGRTTLIPPADVESQGRAYLGSPIFSQRGQIIALAVVRLHAYGNLATLIDRHQVHAEQSRYGFTSRGLIIGTTEPRSIGTLTVSTPLAPHTHGTSHRPYQNYRQQSVLGAWFWSPELNLGIAVEAPAQQSQSLSRQVNQEFASQLFLALLLSSLALVMVYRLQKRHLATLEVSQRRLQRETNLLLKAESLGQMGSWEYRSDSQSFSLSAEMARLLDLPSARQDYSLKEVLSRIAPEDRSRLRQNLQGHYTDTAPFKETLRIRSGMIARQLEFVAASFSLSAPGHSRLLGMARDVTEQRQQQTQQRQYQKVLRQARNEAIDRLQEAEEERQKVQLAHIQLRRSEQLLQSALDAMPASIALLKPDGRVLLLNQGWRDRARQDTKLPPLLGPDDNYLCALETDTSEDSQALREAWSKIATGQQAAFIRQCADIGAAGKTWYEVGIVAAQAERQNYTLVYYLDISERKNIEDALRDARLKAEEASQAKSRFLATMSHEIRTPMNGVVGMLDLLSHQPLTKEQHELADIAKRSSLTLLQIINDILDFSKIEAGKMTLESVPFYWWSVVQEVAELLGESAREKQLQLTFVIPPEFPLWQQGDPTKLRQILFNLVGNAIKFTHSERHKPGRVEVGFQLEDSEEHYVIQVKDSGIGMSPQQCDKLFSAFTQGEDSTQRRYGGTGLGLSISKQLCQLMGGSIHCQSEQGQGSCFTVHLPMDPAPAEEASLPLLSGQRIAMHMGEHPLAAHIQALVQHWQAELLVYDSEQLARSDDACIEADLVLDCHSPQGDSIGLWRSKLKDPAPPLLVLTEGTETDLVNTANTTYLPLSPFYGYKLWQALAKTVGLLQAEPVVSPTHTLPLPSLVEAEAQGRLVLVAEDNKHNQAVFQRQLKLLGYQCLLADNGQQALALLAQHRFGLVITDCHMPVMDGYTLARAIRSQSGQATPIPILAASANALPDEKQRCLDAGMNDYLSKPIELQKLAHKLSLWLGQSTETASTVITTTSTATDTAIDFEQLAQVIGDDAQIQQQLLMDFIQDSAPLHHQLIAAAQQQQTERVINLAHQLKSSARAVGAHWLAEHYGRLEETAKQDKQSDYTELCQSAEQEFIRVTLTIQSITHSSVQAD